MTRRITPRTHVENLKKEAKRRLQELRANHPQTTLREVQHGIAREYGFSGWTALIQALAYDRLASDMVAAYATGNAAAMQRINDHYGRRSTVEDLRATVWRLLYKVRRAKGAAEAFGIPEAQELIARLAGFHNWDAMADPAARVPAYAIDAKENRIGARRELAESEWDGLLAALREGRIATLHAHGFMTDAVLRRVAELDCITGLDLGGSRGLTDEGVRHLARMPQLERLDLTGTNVTDRGLEVLRQLPNLRELQMTWQRGISDEGIANLRFCERLETVNLMGTATGDGAIEALRGKPALRSVNTGTLVSDAGLAMLREFVPLAHLLIDGPFTDSGLAVLAEVKGIEELDVFWHANAITSDAFEVLARVPGLAAFACDGELSDDTAFRHYAAIPGLRKLRAQKAAATDDGYMALSRSASLERYWGREAPHLTGRGFSALSKMPALHTLGVSCQNVDDAALAGLPHFPALRELTPIDVQDGGFRHIGRCRRLERLVCMYCRETTDAATEAIAGLELKSYYAGLTRITDRSLEMLGRMASLESIELFETKAVTDTGLAHLAGLPRLREVQLAGLPHVTFAGTKVFPPHVRVEYEV